MHVHMHTVKNMLRSYIRTYIIVNHARTYISILPNKFLESEMIRSYENLKMRRAGLLLSSSPMLLIHIHLRN